MNPKNIKIKEKLKGGKVFYKPLSDVVFKSMFVNSKILLNGFLDKSLEEKIKVLKSNTLDLPYKSINSKKQRSDVVALLEDGRKAILEMNSSFYKGEPEKNLSYLCNVFSNSIKVGEDYRDVDEVILINYTFGLPDKFPEKAVYTLTDKETGLEYSKKFKIIEFNGSKILKKWYTNGEEKYKHIAMLALSKEELEELEKSGDDFVKEFVKRVKEINEDTEFIEYMSKEEDEEKTRNTYYANGKEEGKAEGKTEGITFARLETARNMLKDKVPTNTIIRYTGLSKKDIKTLEKEI